MSGDSMYKSRSFLKVFVMGFVAEIILMFIISMLFSHNFEKIMFLLFDPFRALTRHEIMVLCTILVVVPLGLATLMPTTSNETKK